MREPVSRVLSDYEPEPCLRNRKGAILLLQKAECPRPVAAFSVCIPYDSAGILPALELADVDRHAGSPVGENLVHLQVDRVADASHAAVAEGEVAAT